MKKEYVISSVDYEMTGGNCYTYYGKLEGTGEWFIYENGFLGIYNADTSKVMNEYMNDEDFDMYEWEQEHLITEYTYDDGIKGGITMAEIEREFKKWKDGLISEAEYCEKVKEIISRITCNN